MEWCPWSRLALSLLAVVCVSCEPPAGRTRPGNTASSPESDRIVLANEWPRGGPPRLWSRKLGPGYAGIIVEGDRLFTMYRDGANEVVIGLNARTGETVWEQRYGSTPLQGQDVEYGEGPNAAPVMADGRLYTIGFAGMMHCLDPATGDVLWSHDLAELGGSVVELGYSASPVEYGDTIIAVVGGRGQGAVAFDKQDGHVVWKNMDFQASFAAPAIMSLHGEDRLVAFMATELVGADPRSGELLWQYAIRNQYPQNICKPIRVDEDLIFVSTTEAGSRGLRIVQGDDGFRVEEAWSTTRIQCFYTTFVLMGDTIYGTSGLQSGPRMSAIDTRTGEIEWRVRGFNLSHIIAIGERLILLDDEGKLTLATPGPEGLEVQAETRILSSPALTPGTLDGTVLFARDQEEIVALELGG